MIRISGNVITPESIKAQINASAIGGIILDRLHSNTKTYDYSSISELDFELRLRDGIIKSARELYKSGISFRTFRNSICNEAYWNRTREGGFALKLGVKPVEAIRDIFANGNLYGTECATAIVIVYYKAVAELFSADRFNETFTDIYLMNWKGVDYDLGVKYQESASEYLPGDCRYFRNPDVDPLTPQWQGENAIDLGDGTYYGHGIGIKPPEGIISTLNKHRKAGAAQSAYLTGSVTRPGFRRLSGLMG